MWLFSTMFRLLSKFRFCGNFFPFSQFVLLLFPLFSFLFFFILGIGTAYQKDYRIREHKGSDTFFSCSGFQECVVSRNTYLLLRNTAGGVSFEYARLNVA